MKHMQEREIKAGLEQAAGQVLFTKQQEMQNLEQIHQKLNRRRSFSMMGKGKKILIAAAAITVLGVTTAIGAGRVVGYFSSSSNLDSHYPNAEDIKDAEELLGIIPKAPEQFSNGLSYQNGAHHTVEGRDESGTTVTTFAQVDVDYGNQVTLSIHKIIPTDEYTGEPVQTLVVDGIEVRAYLDNYLFLPPDAQPSEADLALEAEGKLAISYGTDSEERNTFGNVIWEEDGLQYMISTFNDGYDSGTLLQMAKEVIQSR